MVVQDFDLKGITIFEPEDDALVAARRSVPSGFGFAHAHGPAPMTARIEARFAHCRAEGRAALVTYVMAGDPDPETSLAILRALPQAGADIVEFGLPFTDPMADGPAIQAAGLRALKAGQTTAKTLDLVRRFRAEDADTPVILMGYFNPIYIYGVERFLADAKAAGVDGLIVVDLPPEEDDELCLPALRAGLAFIRLATPTTDDKRLPAVLANTAGFVYYVSITGITGAATPDFGRVADGGRRGSSVTRRFPSCRLRGEDAARTPPRSRRAPTVSWSAPRSSTRSRARSTPRAGRPRKRSSQWSSWCKSWPTACARSRRPRRRSPTTSWPDLSRYRVRRFRPRTTANRNDR